MLCMFVFHFLVISEIIPFDMVWGGKLKTKSEMIKFELLSITITAVLIVVFATYAGYLNINIHPNILKILLFVMSAMFLLNTLGNLVSENALEKAIFTPITFYLAISCFILAIRKKTTN